MRVAVDSGGTFCDFVYQDGGTLSSLKLQSTPTSPERAVAIGLDTFGGRVREVSHGTTVATNAVLERKGAKTAFITTAGFSDLLHIGRQARGSLYDLRATEKGPLVPRDLCFGVAERMGPDGSVILPIDEDEAVELAAGLASSGVESVAVCTLHSYANASHENVIESAVKSLPGDVPVSLSSTLVPEFREYERASTTVLDAYIKPAVSGYLARLEASLGSELYIMRSAGGVVWPEIARRRPVEILLSGPAGGVVAAARVGALLGLENIASFDMGGTSADISLVAGGRPAWLPKGEIDSLPLMSPMLDISTIGAGGGSHVLVDGQGMLSVGPESAGAEPGPVCYGKGGSTVTITDLNLYLGRLNPAGLLAGEFPLDHGAGKMAVKDMADILGMDPVEAAMLGIEVVNSNMLKALRYRFATGGLDPEDFCLMPFGGAGPLHAAELAKELGTRTVAVPPLSGVFSAYGILISDILLTRVRTCHLSLDDGMEAVEEVLTDMRTELQAELSGRGIGSGRALMSGSLDLRYRGQSHELNIGMCPDPHEAFSRAHANLYGYTLDEGMVEVVNARQEARVPREKAPLPRVGKGSGTPMGTREVICGGERLETGIYARRDLGAGFSSVGPAIVEDDTSTLYVPPEVPFSVDDLGVIMMEVR